MPLPGTLQVRPQGGDPRYYSPDRDLAWIYPAILGKAIHGLDQDKWEHWYGDYLRATGTTEDDLGRGVIAFTQAIDSYLTDLTIPDPITALDRSGFTRLPYPVQLTLFARVGMITTGSFFYAARATMIGVTEALQQPSIDEIVEQGRGIAARLQQRAAATPQLQRAIARVYFEDMQAAITARRDMDNKVQEVAAANVALGEKVQLLETTPLRTLIWRRCRRWCGF